MKASPWDQLLLLDLQANDSAIDRLAQKRATLPEIAEIAALEEQLADLDDEIVSAQTEDSDLGREQAKLETDIDVVRSRMSRDQSRLDGGQVGSPRELESLQSEVESLHKRQTELEDAELEFMEQRENLQATIAKLEQRRTEIAASLTATEERKTLALAAIDEDSAAAVSARNDIAGRLPADLVALYEKIRSSSNGVGAAALHRGRCEGCHLALNTTDLNAMRAAADDDVLRCEECRRILIRTDESGL